MTGLYFEDQLYYTDIHYLSTTMSTYLSTISLFLLYLSNLSTIYHIVYLLSIYLSSIYITKLPLCFF